MVGLFLFSDFISVDIAASLIMEKWKVSFTRTFSLIFKILGWYLNLVIILETVFNSKLRGISSVDYLSISYFSTTLEKNTSIILKIFASLDIILSFSISVIFLIAGE